MSTGGAEEVQGSFTEKKTFHQKEEVKKQSMWMPGDKHSSRGNSKGKGPKAGPCLPCWRAFKEASMAAAEGEGRVGREWARSGPVCTGPHGPLSDSSFD